MHVYVYSSFRWEQWAVVHIHGYYTIYPPMATGYCAKHPIGHHAIPDVRKGICVSIPGCVQSTYTTSTMAHTAHTDLESCRTGSMDEKRPQSTLRGQCQLPRPLTSRPKAALQFTPIETIAIAKALQPRTLPPHPQRTWHAPATAILRQSTAGIRSGHSMPLHTTHQCLVSRCGPGPGRLALCWMLAWPKILPKEIQVFRFHPAKGIMLGNISAQCCMCLHRCSMSAATPN